MREGWGDGPGIETRDSVGALGKARSKAADGATMLAIISGSLKYNAICLRIVEFRGPRSCCTAIKETVFDFSLIKICVINNLCS